MDKLGEMNESEWLRRFSAIRRQRDAFAAALAKLSPVEYRTVCRELGVDPLAATLAPITAGSRR